MFFNIGGLEVLVIALVALIAVGPEQLPSVLRKAGKAMAQVRSMTMGLREEFMSGLDEVKDVGDPDKWMGSGSDDDPIVPRGFAQSQNGGAKAVVSDVASDADADAVSETETEKPQINEVARANTMRAEDPKPAPTAEADEASNALLEDDSDSADDVTAEEPTGEDAA